MSLKDDIIKIVKCAKEAVADTARLDTKTKNNVLKDMARELIKNQKFIMRANKKDLAGAKALGRPSVFIDRLSLDRGRIKKMAESISKVADLSDPVGKIIKRWRRPNGLRIEKIRVPIGVIGIIYESRPDVTSDCIALCLKSGNCLLLKGGSEAMNSNTAVCQVLRACAKKSGIPEAAISLIRSTDRKAVEILLMQEAYVDLIIPRGGEGLIKQVAKISRIPVIKHYKGLCHIYVDSDADLKMAKKIVMNAKVQRPGVCNAVETLLVDKAVAGKFLPDMLEELKKAGVEIRGCPLTKIIVKDIKNAEESDWHAEYMDLILSVKIVSGLDEAIAHIEKYGSRHSDAIITRNRKRATEFLSIVDSACVYHNASTRFTDGYQFGFGAEMGISTDKLHARGPMALEELTTYKYRIFGSGQIRK